MIKLLEKLFGKRRVNVTINGKSQIGIYEEETGDIITTKGKVDIKDVDQIIDYGKTTPKKN